MKCKVLLMFLLLAATLTAWAKTADGQTTADSTYTVRVVDAETGEALPLVGVYVSEDNATLTNYDGEFCITAAPTDIVRLTCIGRRTISLRASDLNSEVRLPMLASTMSEITIRAVEGLILKAANQMKKAYERRKNKQAQYFYRQTTIVQRRQDIVEAFIGARSAVNLRRLEFLSGRHGRLTQAAWERSAIEYMNFHHVAELAPMTLESDFWRSLVTPLPVVGGADYLQKNYNINVEELDGDGQELYRITLRHNPETKIEQPLMTGELYLERGSLRVLAFDGHVENMEIHFSKGALQSATVLPVTLSYHIDYRYDRDFPEVADLSMQTNWTDFQTRTLLFNVEGQKRLQHKKGASARENMLDGIASAGYDSTFWAQNEVVKRTAEEAAIAAGTLDAQQARVDSAEAAQAAMPPLQRMADRLTRFGKSIPQEKVFVHMDNTSYRLGDTIWFAAYTRNTATDTPSRISRVLYAELWNHDGYLVERKLVEMLDGRGHGFFALPDTLYAGYFELRAYTRWQLNWGQTEHYHVPYSEYWFYNRAMAKDFFRDYEKLYSRVFPVYDKAEEPGDTFKDMTLRPLRRYFKSEPKRAELRLSIFPEGGNLVAGKPCRVAFEAATSEGEVRKGRIELLLKGKALTIKDDSGKSVEFVETENRGRGTFVFTPEEGMKYDVKFTENASASEASNNKQVSIPLHVVVDNETGAVALQVRRDNVSKTWNIDISAVGAAANQSLGITLMHEGKVEKFEEVDFATEPAAHVSLAIGDAELRTGVNQITVFDTQGRVLADRLFFVQHNGSAAPLLNVEGLKSAYNPYEEVQLSVSKLTDKSEPDTTSATISLAVRDAAQTDITFDSGNILTEMLLASEIKGFVPQPDYFFESDDEEHRRALDLLMLTQGWRRFDWRAAAVKGAWDLTHPAEHTQMVSGTVNQYFAHVEGFNPNLDIAMNEHEEFSRKIDTPVSEQENPSYSDPQNIGGGGSGSAVTDQTSIANRNFGWNINPDAERDRTFETQAASHLSSVQTQTTQWSNNDYNILSYRTRDDYRIGKRNIATTIGRRYVEEGSVGKEVRVHAEFADFFDPNNFLAGNTETRHGRFQLDLPRFNGQCVFFLDASDTTKWKKGEEHAWVKVDPTDEYSQMPTYPEYYVRLNWAYPRWVKPYTYYQVRTPSLTAQKGQSSYNLTAKEGDAFIKATEQQQAYTPGSTLETTMDEVTVRARHNGLRRIDYSKPAYVIDALEALNLCMDAGLIDYTFSAYDVGKSLARILVSDMGMERHYDLKVIEDSEPGKFRGPLEQRRYQLLTFIDNFYVYTDYSPRREGDERYEQDNQPEVCIDIRRMPEGAQRLTYVNRRLILNGFAYQEDFYNPDYKRTPPTETTHDYRRTLYWNPDLRLDANGRADIRFFTGSHKTSLSVDAQGQSADGTLLFTR